jgi:hypothetical protein
MAAGRAEPQRPLESGFDIFRAIKGAQDVIALNAALLPTNAMALE